MATETKTPTLADALLKDWKFFDGTHGVSDHELQLFHKRYNQGGGQSRRSAVVKAGGKVAFNVATQVNGATTSQQIVASVPAGDDSSSMPDFAFSPVGVSLSGIPSADGFHEDGTKIDG